MFDGEYFVKRLLLYLDSPQDIYALLPVYNQLTNNNSYEVLFGHTPSSSKQNEEQVIHLVDIIKKLNLPLISDSNKYNPGITIFADFTVHKINNPGRKVFVPRSLASEGKFYQLDNSLNYYNEFDLITVPGEYHKLILEKSNRVFAPILATGVPRLDRFFQHAMPSRETLFKTCGINPDQRVILYIPSTSIAHSAVPILWTRIQQIVDEKTTILIALDFAPSSETFQAHSSIAENNTNMHLLRNTDYDRYIQLADIIISDVHSAWLEAKLLDKQVVLFDNPNSAEWPSYHPNAPENMFRDYAVRSSSLEDIKAALGGNSRETTEKDGQSENINIQLHHLSDGNASQRIAEEIVKLVENKVYPVKWNQERLDVLISTDTEDDSAIELINSLDNSPTVLKTFLHLLTTEKVESYYRNKIVDEQVNIVLRTDVQAIKKILKKSNYIAMISDQARIGSDALKRLVNQVRRNNGNKIVVPVLVNGSPVQDPLIRFGIEPEIAAEYDSLDKYSRFRHMAIAVPVESKPGMDIVVFPDIEEYKDSIIKYLSEGIIPDLSQDNTLLALDVVGFVNERKLDSVDLIEQRIRQLADWISSPLPKENGEKLDQNSDDFLRVAPDRKSTESYNNNGHVRLANHYQKQGNRKKVLYHLKKATSEINDDTILHQLVDEFDVSLEELVQ